MEFLTNLRSGDEPKRAYRGQRFGLQRVTLLGLRFPIVADIIHAVGGNGTIENVALGGPIVMIRIRSTASLWMLSWTDEGTASRMG